MDAYTRGSTSMIALLVGVALAASAYVYFFLTPRAATNPELTAVQPPTASGAAPTTEYGRSRADIDAARRTQELLDNQQNAINAALSE